MSQDQLYYLPAVITGNALAESKEKRTPSVSISMRTIPQEGEQAQTLYANLWLTDGAFDATVKTLRETLGWQGNDLMELNQPILKDIEVVAVCAWGEYNGQGRYEVRFLNSPGGGGGVKKLDEGQARSIVSRLNAKLVATSKGSGAASAPAARRPASSRAPKAPGHDDFPGYAPPEAETF
jgi:hypothetical protein